MIAMPLSARAASYRARASSESGAIRHWTVLLTKVCRQLAPAFRARSNARQMPPEIDMCAPISGAGAEGRDLGFFTGITPCR